MGEVLQGGLHIVSSRGLVEIYCPILSEKAEDEGFKPPIPGKGYTGFRVQRIRSLCQSSSISVCKGNEKKGYKKVIGQKKSKNFVSAIIDCGIEGAN